MNCVPNWTNYLTALLTPVVAIVGSYIAYRQWFLAQNKLKLELFDRRFSVYEAARNLLGSIMTSGRAKEEDIFKFMVATRESKWLLNASIADYLDKQLYRKALELQALTSNLEGISIDIERAANIHRQANIKEWFLAQYDTLDQHFTPFLLLEN